MKTIQDIKLEEKILSATVTYKDTGETYILKTRAGSACHFFDPFTVGNDEIQLRLDWSDLDQNGQPTLDADFIDKKTGKHRSLKGKRQDSHHTSSTPGEERIYEWAFNGFSRQFIVTVIWSGVVSERLIIRDFCSAELISSAGQKLENG